MGLSRILAGSVELALEVQLRDLDIPQCHADIFVPQQLHQSRKTDTETDHLGSEAVPQLVGRDRAGAAGSLGGVSQCRSKGLVQSVMATTAGQQQVPAVGQAGGRRQSTQSQDASHDPSNVCVGRHQAFGVQFAYGDMQRPLVHTDLPQTVQREIDALADADSGGASEQQCIGRQVVGAAQFLLQQLIVLGRKRSWQVPGLRRKVVATDEVGRKAMAIGGQIVQQPAETDQKVGAGFITQGRLSLAQRAEPAKQMGIAAELAEPAHLRKGRADVGQEAASGATIAAHGVGTQSQSESLDVCFQDLFEAVSGLAHRIGEESKRVRFSMARAYSLQTSFGASWT